MKARQMVMQGVSLHNQALQEMAMNDPTILQGLPGMPGMPAFDHMGNPIQETTDDALRAQKRKPMKMMHPDSNLTLYEGQGIDGKFDGMGKLCSPDYTNQ